MARSKRSSRPKPSQAPPNPTARARPGRPASGTPAIHIPAPWRSRRALTPESVYWNRRAFLKSLGAAGLAALVPGCGHQELTKPSIENCDRDRDLDLDRLAPLSPVTANAAYALAPSRPLTSARSVMSWNNFYEFTLDRELVWCLAKPMRLDPWSIQIAGLTESPRTVSLEDVLALAPLEERAYRFRCVEAWAMTVPWVGYPLADFIRWCRPRPEATHVRFFTDYQPDAMANHSYVWPYYDGLRLDEALHELAFLAVGLYGRELPRQNGAPVRVITPWKYGYKSIKSVVRVEFVSAQPRTFWNDIAPQTYPFLSNVDPAVPHPGWSQASETLIDTGDEVPTLKFNGYGEWVAGLYSGI